MITKEESTKIAEFFNNPHGFEVLEILEKAYKVRESLNQNDYKNWESFLIENTQRDAYREVFLAIRHIINNHLQNK